MEGVAQFLPMVGTLLTGGSAVTGGMNARRAGQYEAAQADVAAGQQIAASHRTAADIERQSKLLQSRALAVAAASGGGASDPTVLDIISGIAGEGAYRSQLALYEGKDNARAIQARGDAAKYEGKAAQRAGILKGVGTVLRGGATLYEKYGRPRRGATDYGVIDPTLAGDDLPY